MPNVRKTHHNRLRRTMWETIRKTPGVALTAIKVPITTRLKLMYEFRDAGYITLEYRKHVRWHAYHLTMAPKWAGVPFEKCPEYIPVPQDEPEAAAQQPRGLEYFARRGYYADVRGLGEFLA